MRNHTASKRSASPVESSNRLVRDRDQLPQTDGCVGSKPEDDISTMSPVKILKMTKEEVKPARPAMPAFLKLTDDETHARYTQLAALEHERLGLKNDPNSQWQRSNSDAVMDRYTNIHPWALNRVTLKVPPGIPDYINASPVSLVSTVPKQSEINRTYQDKYICMQGPKVETIDHTWHMVWHELAAPYDTSPAVIIMLSATHGPDPSGNGKIIEKCSVYFPMDENSPPIRINESNILGENFKATVRFESREPPVPGSTLEIRKFIMTVDGEEDEEKPIWHFLYPSWPDFGALEERNVSAIINVMEESRKKNGKGENPRIVHCSAGVGRTGTFVALEFLMGELQGGAWESGVDSGMDPVYDTVNQLRLQRRAMVQAYEQYAFLYEVLRKMWEEKYDAQCVGGNHDHGPDDQGREKQDGPAS